MDLFLTTGSDQNNISGISSSFSSSLLSKQSQQSKDRAQNILLTGFNESNKATKDESFVYNLIEVMTKNTVEMMYFHTLFSISPFEILSDQPEGDYDFHRKLEWSGVLNCSVITPKILLFSTQKTSYQIMISQ